MCTVSVIPLLEAGSGRVIGLRLVSNRDESRKRPEALPPTWRELEGGGRAIWPLDPLAGVGPEGTASGNSGGGGGTWIAANNRGVVFSILNVNIPDQMLRAASTQVKPLSRGLIIPAVATSSSALDAVEQVAAMDLRSFAPFRLVIADAGDGLRVADLRWDGQGADVTIHGSMPVAFASSGLGDRVVEVRLPLFEEIVDREHPSPQAQDRFHHHRWEQGGPGDHDGMGWARSVLMCREAARTVSMTTVTVVGEQVQMTTVPVPDSLPEQLEHPTQELVPGPVQGPGQTTGPDPQAVEGAGEPPDSQVVHLRAHTKTTAGTRR